MRETPRTPVTPEEYHQPNGLCCMTPHDDPLGRLPARWPRVVFLTERILAVLLAMPFPPMVGGSPGAPGDGAT